MSGLDEAVYTIEPAQVESRRVAAEEMERQLFAQMDKPRISKAMDKYFLGTPSKYETKITKPTRRLWTEGALKEFLAEAIRDVTGDRRLVRCDNSGSYIAEQAKTPDAVILTHAAVTASPDLQLVWAQSQDPTPTESRPPAPRRAYSLTSVAIEVKESDTMSAEARKQMVGRLHMIRTTAHRAHAIGVTLCGDLLQVYLVNASGAFTTNARKCGEEAVLLRRVLSRLIELDDDDDDGLGMLASLNEVDDVLGTFVVSDKLLPPRAHDFESELGDLRDLEIQEFLTRRRICRRLTTSACYAIARHAPVDPTAITPITSTSPTPAVEYAIMFVWAEHSLLDDGIALHRKMHAASRADTQGLSLSAGIYRGDLRTLPTFLGVDENFDGIEPRALEVVFIRQSYWPLSTTRTTKELAQAVLGVVKGLRNLYKLGYIHGDISYDSVVIDRDGVGALLDYHLAVPHDRPCTELYRRIRYDAWPYLPCSILAEPQQPLRVDHERWHDIESLFYLVMEISFREPYMGDYQVLVMTPDGETFWEDWNEPSARMVYVFKELLRLNHRYHKLLKGCAQRWTNIKQLVDILRSNYGLDNRFIGLEVAMEEDQLGKLWGPSGTMSHEAIISEIERLLPSL